MAIAIRPATAATHPAVRADMQPAFLLRFVFPPPAAGALRLAGRDGAGAGRAADGDEALRMQRVDRDVVGRAISGDRRRAIKSSSGLALMRPRAASYST